MTMVTCPQCFASILTQHLHDHRVWHDRHDIVFLDVQQVFEAQDEVNVATGEMLNALAEFVGMNEDDDE